MIGLRAIQGFWRRVYEPTKLRELKGDELQALFANGNHEPHFRILNEAERDAIARTMGCRDWQEFCDCAEAVSTGSFSEQEEAIKRADANFERISERLQRMTAEIFEPRGSKE